MRGAFPSFLATRSIRSARTFDVHTAREERYPFFRNRGSALSFRTTARDLKNEKATNVS
jgi:hypothetical protein